MLVAFSSSVFRLRNVYRIYALLMICPTMGGGGGGGGGVAIKPRERDQGVKFDSAAMGTWKWAMTDPPS